MGKFYDAVKQQEFTRGMELTKVDDIISVMSALHIDIAAAMTILNVSKDEYPIYTQLVEDKLAAKPIRGKAFLCFAPFYLLATVFFTQFRYRFSYAYLAALEALLACQTPVYRACAVFYFSRLLLGQATADEAFDLVRYYEALASAAALALPWYALAAPVFYDGVARYAKLLLCLAFAFVCVFTVVLDFCVGLCCD